MSNLAALLGLVLSAQAALSLPLASGVATPVPSYVTESVWREKDGSFGRLLAMRELGDGNVLVVGEGTICLLAEDGALLSAVPLSRPFASFQGSYELAVVDPLGSVYLATAVAETLLLTKQDGRTGRPLWPAPQTYRIPGRVAELQALSLSPEGHPIVLLGSRLDSSVEVAVLSYRSDSGEPRHDPRPVGLAGDHTVRALVVDGAGDLVIASAPWTGAAVGMLAIVKLSGADGRVLWGPVSPGGTAADPERVLDLALDGADVLLLSLRMGPGGDSNLRTSRFAGEDGRESFVRHSSRSHSPYSRGWLRLDRGPHVFVIADVSGGYVIDRLEVATGAVLAGAEVFGGWPGPPVSAGGGVCVPALHQGRFVVRRHGADGRVVWMSDDGPGCIECQGPGDLQAIALRSGDLVTANRWFTGVSHVAAASRHELGTGRLQWGQTLDGPTENGLFWEQAVAGGDTVFVTGVSRDIDPGRSTLETLAFDQVKGARSWGPIPFVPLRYSSDEHRSVVVAGGDLVRASTGVDSDSLGSAVTVDSLAASSGATVWGPKTLRPGLFQGMGLVELATDGLFGVQVLGSSGSGGEVFSLDARDGSVRHHRTFPGITPVALAVASDGHSLVTGVDGVGRGWVMALDGAGGDLWGPVRLDLAEPLTSGGRKGRILFDSWGDVFTVWARWPYVVKLDGRTGVPSWDPLGISYNLDPAFLALDGSDRLVISGARWPQPGEREIVTLRVDPATGAVVWGPVVQRDSQWSAAPRGMTLSPFADVLILAPVLTQSPVEPPSRIFRYDVTTGDALEGFDPPFEASSIVPLQDGFLLASQSRIARYGYGIGLDLPGLPPARCGAAYEAPLRVRNGAPPYALEIGAGTLPQGLFLQTEPPAIAGAPSGAPGRYTFTVEVSDGTGTRSARELNLDVLPADDLRILGPTLVCEGGPLTLQAPGGFAAYAWQPGGETTATILVSPERSTAYTVTVTDAAGAVRRGSLEVATIPGARPPQVFPPAPAVVLATTCLGGLSGATPATSGALAAFLAGGFASDTCDPVPVRLPARIGDVEVTSATFLPSGTSTLTFRFRDTSGAVGESTQTVRVLPLGDLDGSSAVDVIDVVLLAGHLAGNISAGVPPFTAPAAVADVDGSGSVDIFDLVLLVNRLVGNALCTSRSSAS